MARSTWMSVVCDSDHHRAAVKSWFSPLCDDMTPEKAEILVDNETDQEKKVRALMVDGDGTRHLATRTRGKTFSIALKKVKP